MYIEIIGVYRVSCYALVSRPIELVIRTLPGVSGICDCLYALAPAIVCQGGMSYSACLPNAAELTRS